MLKLHEIKPKKGSKKRRIRVGRGLSKKGTYSGRGVKGQRARSGGRSGLKLKGLRPIMLAQPKKRGFVRQSDAPAIVNLVAVSKNFKDSEQVTPRLLKQRKVVDDIVNGVKILGSGELNKKLIFRGCVISESARKKIEAAGGAIK